MNAVRLSESAEGEPERRLGRGWAVGGTGRTGMKESEEEEEEEDEASGFKYLEAADDEDDDEFEEDFGFGNREDSDFLTGPVACCGFSAGLF